jgi:CMP-N-acetylneuraminic acid synthetase
LSDNGIVAVVPAKVCSERVAEKNYRPFFGMKSLVDVTIEKLLRVLPPDRIFLSCEDPDKRSVADRWGIEFIKRDKYYCLNETPLPEVIRHVCAQVPGDGDVMWSQVIEPTFNEYQRCIDAWSENSAGHDSLVVVHERRAYFLDDKFRPEGFGFGYWHIPSQRLAPKYQLTFTLSILSRSAIADTGYVVGRRPYWYVADDPGVDIDTKGDFELARTIYTSLMQQRCNSDQLLIESRR